MNEAGPRLSLAQSRQLDSLRALSAFVVLLGHTYQTLLLPTLQSWFTAVVLAAQMAVMVFFVLSGLLIGKSVSNNLARHGRFDAVRYFKDRALRLYPPLLAAVALMLGLGLLAPLVFPSGTSNLLEIAGAQFVRSSFVVAPNDVLGALTFLNGFVYENPSSNSPLWSLSLEFWYYVAAAALFVWRGNRLGAVALLALVAYVARANPLFWQLAPVWFAGFGLAWLHTRGLLRERLFTWLFAVMSLAFAGATAYALYPDWSGNQLAMARIGLFRLVSGLWFACFLALLLDGRVRFGTWLYRHAGYSYTLYVIHFPIMLFALGVFQPRIHGDAQASWLLSAAVVLVALVVAWALSRVVENRTLLRAGLRVLRKGGSSKASA
ncbi:MAG: acyltransferase [Paucimonas sp.]|jgi:peptidoglycan/LPS O-acetylase OafA/YrhL|uniref:acyltransferase family protein n=1 Tax=Pantoea sp. Cy-639 TaxID=2608360 RepID=UPI0014215FE5|nr:acyltransferase [Pantoea sp. Cy-639]MDR2307107.1 acyltransferase [Paucimonas sp.]NIF18694.1 acyltransferase [Pantoea sp. Cy-639]